MAGRKKKKEEIPQLERRATRSTTAAASISPNRHTDSPLPRRRRGATPEVVGTPLKSTPSKIKTRRASLLDTPQDLASPVRRSRRLSTSTDEVATPSKTRNLRSVRTNLKLVEQPVPEEEEQKQRTPNSLRQKKDSATSMSDENRNETSTEKGSGKLSAEKSTETSNEEVIAEKDGTKRKPGRPVKSACSPRLQNTVVMLKKLDENTKPSGSVSPISRKTRNSLGNEKGECKEDCESGQTNPPLKEKLLDMPRKVYSNKNKQLPMKGHIVTDNNVIVILDDEEEERQKASMLSSDLAGSLKEEDQNTSKSDTIDVPIQSIDKTTNAQDQLKINDMIHDVSGKDNIVAVKEMSMSDNSEPHIFMSDSVDKGNESEKSNQDPKCLEADDLSNKNVNIGAESIADYKADTCFMNVIDKHEFESDSEKVENTKSLVKSLESTLEVDTLSVPDAESIPSKCEKAESTKDSQNLATEKSIADESIEELKDEKSECPSEAAKSTLVDATQKAIVFSKENTEYINTSALGTMSGENRKDSAGIEVLKPMREDITNSEHMEPTDVLMEDCKISTKDSILDAEPNGAGERSIDDNNKSIRKISISLSEIQSCENGTRMCDSFEKTSESLVSELNSSQKISKPVDNNIGISQVSEPEFVDAKSTGQGFTEINHSAEPSEASASDSRTSDRISAEPEALASKFGPDDTEANTHVYESEDILKEGGALTEVSASRGESKAEMEKMENEISSPKEFVNVAFAKSWNQSVRGPLNKSINDSEYIDAISVKHTQECEKLSPATDSERSSSIERRKNVDETTVSSDNEVLDEDGDEASQNEFIDDEAMEVSEGDCSLDSSERAYMEENEIPVQGESIGSEDTLDELEDEEGEEDEEMASFIVSESELDKLSGNDSLIDSEGDVGVKKKRKFRRVIERSDTSSDESEAKFSSSETCDKSNSPKESEPTDSIQPLGNNESAGDKSNERNDISEEAFSEAKDEENETRKSFDDSQSPPTHSIKDVTSESKCSNASNLEEGKIFDGSEKNLSMRNTEACDTSLAKISINKQCNQNKCNNDDISKDYKIITSDKDDVDKDDHIDSNSETCSDQSKSAINTIIEGAETNNKRQSVVSLVGEGEQCMQASTPKSLKVNSLTSTDTCEKDASINSTTEQSEIIKEKSQKDPLRKRWVSDLAPGSVEYFDKAKKNDYKRKSLLSPKLTCDKSSEKCKSKILNRHSTGNVDDNKLKSNAPNTSTTGIKCLKATCMIETESEFTDSDACRNAVDIKTNNYPRNSSRVDNRLGKSKLSVNYVPGREESSDNDKDIENNESPLGMKHESSTRCITKSGDSNDDTNSDASCKFSEDEADVSAVRLHVDEEKDNDEEEEDIEEHVEDLGDIEFNAIEEKSLSFKNISPIKNQLHKSKNQQSFDSTKKDGNDLSVNPKLSNMNKSNSLKGSFRGDNFCEKDKCANDDHKLSTENQRQLSTDANRSQSITSKARDHVINEYEISTHKRSDLKNISLPIINKKGNNLRKRPYSDEFLQKSADVSHDSNYSSRRMSSLQMNKQAANRNELGEEIECGTETQPNRRQIRKSLIHDENAKDSQSVIFDKMSQENPLQAPVLTAKEPHCQTINHLGTIKFASESENEFEGLTKTDRMPLTRERNVNLQLKPGKIVNQILNGHSPIRGESASSKSTAELPPHRESSSDSSSDDLDRYLSIAKNIGAANKSKSFSSAKGNNKLTPTIVSKSDGEILNHQESIVLAQKHSNKKKLASRKVLAQEDKIQNSIKKDQAGGKQSSTANVKGIFNVMPLLDDSTNRDLDEIIMAAKKKVHSPEDNKALMKTISKLVSKSLKNLSKFEIAIDESQETRKNKTKKEKSRNVLDNMKNALQSKGSQNFTEGNSTDDSHAPHQKHVAISSTSLKATQLEVTHNKEDDLVDNLKKTTKKDKFSFTSIKNTNQSTPAHSLKIKINDVTYCSTDGHENVQDDAGNKTFNDTSYTIASDDKKGVCDRLNKNGSASGKNKKTKKKRGRSRIDSKVAASSSSDNSFENYLPQSRGGNNVKHALKSQSIATKKAKFGEESEVLKELIVNRIEEAKAEKFFKKKRIAPEHNNITSSGEDQLSAFEFYHKKNQKRHIEHVKRASAVKNKLGCRVEDANASTGSSNKSSTSVTSSNSISRANEWLITDLRKNKNSSSSSVKTRLPFGFEEMSATPKKVNGFQVEAVSPKSSDWMVTSIHHSSKERKRSKLEKNPGSHPLPAEVWTSVGYFKVTDADIGIRRQKKSRDLPSQGDIQSKKRRKV